MRSLPLLILLFALPSAPAAAAGSDFSVKAIWRAIQQAMPQWAPVDMHIFATPDGYTIEEMDRRISMYGRGNPAKEWAFNGWAAGRPVTINAAPISDKDPRLGYSLFGDSANVWLRPFGNGFSLTGTVGQRPLWLQAEPLVSGGWRLWGQMGLELNAPGTKYNLWVTGRADLSEFNEQGLAVLGAALSVLHSLPPAK